MALGAKIQAGAWGGGNQFARAFRDFLLEQGHSVVDRLQDSDIDVIILMTFRYRGDSATFSYAEAARYQRRHPKVRIVHRINECDARKGTRFVDFQIGLANRYADSTVLVGAWMEDYFRSRGIRLSPLVAVTRSGGDRSVFFPGTPRPAEEVLRIITHHWSSSWSKGWDVYLELDARIADGTLRGVELVYVGTPPENVKARSIRFIAPLHGNALADQLRSADLYLTASLNEPSGNHHIEGALCGLPLLYRESGGLPEFCRGFGVSFDGPADVVQRLNELIRDREKYREALHAYPYDTELMNRSYLSAIAEVRVAHIREKPGEARLVWDRLVSWLLHAARRLGIE